jgi:phenylpropionate dioxygenase-like ring-hydroxylating dioxygenase large terminal subunit
MARLRGSANVEELLATGLRNRWYAVCPSSFVEPGAMRRVTCLGEHWVLFREPDGALHMLADRCPHRGAPLSPGSHLGNRIACAYHGVQVDGSGTVVCVPGMPGCKMEGRRIVRSLPLEEFAGAVLAWFGDEKHQQPGTLVPPEYLRDEAVSSFLCYAEWDVPWRFAAENVLDPMHGAFLHRESHSMFAGSTTASFKIRETDRGFYFEKTDQQNTNFDWVELCRTGVDWVNLAIPYPPSGGPGGPFGVVGMVTPATATSCKVFFWRYRRVQGWQRSVWRFLYRTTLEERHWAVLEQDRLMLEAMALDADAAEHLYQHDLGVVRVRRLMRAEAERQVAELTDDGPGTRGGIGEGDLRVAPPSGSGSPAGGQSLRVADAPTVVQVP